MNLTMDKEVVDDLAERGVAGVNETFVDGVSTGHLGASSDRVPVVVAAEMVNGAGDSAGSGSCSSVEESADSQTCRKRTEGSEPWLWRRHLIHTDVCAGRGVAGLHRQTLEPIE
jgi:hypothetical protein